MPAKRPKSPRQAGDWQRYAAPGAFLLAFTIAILLVRGSFGGGGGNPVATTAPVTTSAPATTTSGRTTTSRTSTGTTTGSSGAVYHDVQAGDTFGTIAAQYGKSVAEIEALNPGVSSTSLHIGQRIRVG